MNEFYYIMRMIVRKWNYFFGICYVVVKYGMKYRVVKG